MNEGSVVSHVGPWQVVGLVHAQKGVDQFSFVDLLITLIR